MFFDYAAYASGIAWVVLFGHVALPRAWATKHVRYSDRLNLLNAAYRDVPASWYRTMFAGFAAALVAVHFSGYLFMPWWVCVVAIAVEAVIVTPLMWLYAVSNFQLPIGTFNALLYGFLVQKQRARLAAGTAFFGCVTGTAWYRAQFHLELMKLGFYNHLPPRTVFFAQCFGVLIGVPVNYFTFRWVLSSKADYLSGKLVDPLHQSTGQTVVTYHINAIQYVVLGPRRLFANYPLLPYGFVLGLLAPALVYLLRRRFATSAFQFRLWNTTGHVLRPQIQTQVVAPLQLRHGRRARHGLQSCTFHLVCDLSLRHHRPKHRALLRVGYVV